MTKDEYLADLQTKVLWIGEAKARKMAGNTDTGIGSVQGWTVPVIEIAGQGTNSLNAHRFLIVNVDVVAGPLLYEGDVFDDDGITLLHSAGDPVLDDEGNPVVIPPEAAERVIEEEIVRNPVADTINAVTYLETQKALGAWDHYLEDDLGPKRPDLGFFAIRAFVSEAGGYTEKRFLVSYDSEGAATHTEIV